MNILLEPNSVSVEGEMVRTGLSFEVCRERLSKRMEADFSRLTNLSPAGASELSKVVEEASQKLDKASALHAARLGAVQALQQMIIQLGQVREFISEVRRLETTDSTAAQIAEIALDSFVANLKSQSPQNKFGFTEGISDLAKLKALAPFVAPYAEKLESKAAKLVASIRESCKAEKIQPAKLLETLYAESAQRTEQNQARNPALVGYADAGYFDDLVK